MKIILTSFLFISLLKVALISSENWTRQDKTNKFWSNFAKPHCLNQFDENCDFNDNRLEFTSNLIKRKSEQHRPDSILSGDMECKKTKIIPYYQSTRSMPCSCGMEFQLRNLGAQYYPRYILEGQCKQDSCGGFYRCVERHYKVRVLKERDPDSLANADVMTLPENLRDYWEPEVITVTVACECVP